MNIYDTSINPSIIFYKSYEGNIQKVRQTLFAELDNISSDFRVEAKKILEEKLKSNQNKPLLGELFPWIIKDLINANDETTHKISVGWLAIYLYTLFLDDYVDNPQPMSSTKFITGSVLAKTGLLKISKFTHDSPYEKYIDKAFSFSAFNQNLDAKFQKKTLAIEKKIKYSEGKNYVVLACAGALAAQNNKHAEFITEFTKTLLLSLQYLDDVTDFEEDFRANNFTVLWSDAFKNNPKFNLELKTSSNRKLLEELISTGALKRVIEKIENLLNQSILLIKQNEFDNKSRKASKEFFISLQTYIVSFKCFLEANYKNFREFPRIEQDIILDKTEKYITIIAQST